MSHRKSLPWPRPIGRRSLAASAAGVLGVALLAALPQAVAAPDDNGLFELDANVMEDGSTTTGDDWSNIHAGTSDALPGANTGIVPDPSPSSIFTGGGSKDHADIGSWKHRDGSVPDKDDITHAYAAAYGLGGQTYAYFGLDRLAVQGSSNVGFWFFQDAVAPQAGGTFTGSHEVGDLLVLSEFDGGGQDVTIKVFKWVGSGGDEGGGSLETLFGGGSGAPADCDALPASPANVCGNVNTAAIPDSGIPWNYVAKGGSRNMPVAAFFEGGINLSAFFGATPCFTNMVAETRSSFEVNAVLKDFAHSRFALCDAELEFSPDAVNDVGDSHTFTVTASRVVGGNQTPAADGTVVDVTLSGVAATVTADTCADPGTVGGTCSVTFSSSTAGVVTAHAEADIVVGDTTMHEETGGTGNNPDAVKRFVDARISISPSAVNGINEPHTFVVDVDQDLGGGAGFVAATVGDVDFTLTDTLGAASVLDVAASTCDDTGNNLDASGRCTITFTSGSTGTVTGHAEVSLSLTTDEGTIAITRETDGTAPNTGDAVKRYVDGSLAWVKNDDSPARLAGASFEVCRTHTLDTSTNPDTFVDITPDVCVTVLDDAGLDTDADDGEFLLVDLVLGRYTVDEVAPFPAGYQPDPDVVTADLTLQPGPKDVTLAEAFVNRALYRLIVITCNTVTEELVDSTVELDDDTRETVKPGQLGDIDETDLCGLAGANYDNLTRGDYTPAVELPDLP